ncbi:MAG: hypothetical protein A3G33_09865 [Omnitrophica bacterium RIFCSPLOWO2_12_FULL_44_17]|uniref:Peptidase M48 domain-containing protein n=1 Tax=Candidatus Danuiimicrobium aquiferis TaxID=1801832 RepID=A0A1G1L123_9BACT|nr:MAG: hypothetical protein A3B72_11135 [Omnitrophica bacterium RIFCSPHIGHO2_02_FULL_45_28]OGW98853.1 MAG: hypothetical protein A3G33_09865 [Omnitrophica bacterium RIFCSPLOWO2_12_FULL_44_17]OGX04100.1 MAG: hypothetical protein A3J12_02230 [Omnitrophica bacterium RIFCSPLOWO2_02_FULL_44_11]
MKRHYFILIFFLFTGCAALNPWIENVNIIPIPYEIQAGQEMAKTIIKETPLSTDSALNAKVAAIGNRLVATLPKKDFNYAFYAVQNKEPNAFTTPGGKIYVQTGLIQFSGNENELAGVLAHELGHAYNRHPSKAMTRTYGVEALTNLILNKNQSQLKNIALSVAKTGILTKYSRNEEREADEFAFNILQKAGYPTTGLVSFLEKIEKLQTTAGGPTWLATHPPTPERIARLKALEANQKPGSITTAQGSRL